jgi:hypothetical protein
LSFTPASNRSGTAIITVTVRDNGGTTNGGIDTVTRSFTVTVTAVNDAPTLDPIAGPLPILEDAGSQTVNLTGIGAGADECADADVTATSSNPGLIPDPRSAIPAPMPPDSELHYRCQPVGHGGHHRDGAGQAGTANGGVDAITRTFTVTVTAVNDAPTLAPIGPVTILEDAGPADGQPRGIRRRARTSRRR